MEYNLIFEELNDKKNSKKNYRKRQLCIKANIKIVAMVSTLARN